MATPSFPSSSTSIPESQLTAAGITAVQTDDTIVFASTDKKVKSTTPITVTPPANTTTIFEDLKASNVTIKASAGNDTLVFGTGSIKTELKSVDIDLGGGNDVLRVGDKGKLKGTIRNFGAGDQIITKKGTFTSADINDKGKIKGLGGIRFI